MTNLLGRRARGSYRIGWDDVQNKSVMAALTGEIVGVYVTPSWTREIWILERHCGTVRICQLEHVTILPPEFVDEDPVIGAVPR